MFFVNPLACVGVLAGTRRLRSIAERPRQRRVANFDALGAVLVDRPGCSLLVYATRRGTRRRLGRRAAPSAALAGAAVLLVAFVVNELRTPNPLLPLSIFRIKGLAAADVTQLIAIAGFFSMFFFLTLYMQNVLGFSPIQAGAAYLPVTVGVVVAAGVCSQAVRPHRHAPIIVAGA